MTVTLSKFLVTNIIPHIDFDTPLSEIIHKTREQARVWWGENEDIVKVIRENFELGTGLSYDAHKDDIINGFSDHYAEKIYVSGTNTQNYINMVQTFDFNPDDVKTFQETIKERPVLVMTAHFGGVDLLPSSMAMYQDLRLPTSVFLRFKSSAAQESAFQRLAELENVDYHMVNADGSLAKYLRRLTKSPRILFTVSDAFYHWRRPDDGFQTEICGHSFTMDNTSDRLSRLLNARVFFGVMVRTGVEKYRFELKELQPDSQFGYAKPIFETWWETVRKYPTLWYAWDEFHEIWNPEGRIYKKK